MRIMYFLASVPLLLLMGCQSMGDHYNCMAEVDRTVPAQTQQKYLRTDTKCTKSNEQSLGGGMGTIYNPAQGDVNCSSVPVYENIILNKSQRDSAYQNCRRGLRSASANNVKGKSVYNLQDAEEACTSATVKGSDAYIKCVNELVKTSR